MQNYKMITSANTLIMIVLAVAYLYQGVFLVIGLLHRREKRLPPARTLHRFAALICARNEEQVIAELIDSLKKQDYPAELFDIFVLADNCTDRTAAAARAAGALVYERHNKQQVGKGYAMEYLLQRIDADHGKAYEGFFVFDADNIIDPQFVREMNTTFDAGYQVITCYRNSKNFGANWISAGYSIWFLREARFLNHPRMLTGNSCAVSGTGFMVSRKVIEQNGGWPFHLLTEDIQFSVNCAVQGVKIGYCDKAIVYDEQPVSFAQSWTQRLRWSKGFFQVDAKYLLPLTRGMIKNKGHRFSCYDMFMTVAPCTLFSIAALLINLFFMVACLTQPHHIMLMISRDAGQFIASLCMNYYLSMFLFGALAVLSEWKRIPATAFEKIIYLAAFPLFMATYLPITVAALLCRVEWKPITHTASKEYMITNRKV